MKKPCVIDLFVGAGGFSLGAHLAGFSTALAIDIDKDLTSSFKDNFPHSTLLFRDISQIDPKEVLKSIDKKPGTVDGVIGGPPCQGFSYIGKRDPTDKRNDLIGHFFRFVSYIQPAFFVMENVPGLLSGEFMGVLKDGIGKIAERYMIVGPLIVDTADYEAATKRKRMIVIGYLPDRVNQLTEAKIEAVKTPKRVTVAEAIMDLPPLSAATTVGDGQFWARYKREPTPGTKGEYARRARNAPKRGLGSKQVRQDLKLGLISGFQPTIHTREVIKRFNSVIPGKVDRISRCPRLDWSKQCPTLRAGTGKDQGSYQAVRPIHPEEDRVISVREAARLQGFPDWFQFHPTKWHSFRMIGNSVSPILAERILTVIRKSLGNG